MPAPDADAASVADTLRSAPGALHARPQPVAHDARTGLVQLKTLDTRPALLYVPGSYRADHPAALAVLFHGSGGEPRHALAPLFPLADAAHLSLLAPAARRFTWDAVLGDFDDDVQVVDELLAHVFAGYAVNPAHVAIGGFSDGASYALSLGLRNGALFSHVIAFSPGFVSGRVHEGAPRIFVSHGRDDTVLPVDRCSRRIVPSLERAGLRVVYREFAGGHAVPADVARDAVSWLLGAEHAG
jgi:predicted esterase